MPVHHWKASFIKGEISDKLLARQDWDGWRDASHCLENVVVTVQGGATRRAGTAFICQAGDSGYPVRLEPFVYSQSVAYAIEFGHLYARFIRNRVLLRQPESEPAATLSVTGITGTVTLTVDNPVWTDTPTDVGREIAILGGGYLRIVSVTSTTVATADVLEDLPTVGPFPAGNWNLTGVPVEVVTPYLGTEVFELQCTQSGDRLYICHTNHPPARIERLSETSFRYVVANIDPPPSEEVPTYPDGTLTLDALTGNNILATSSVAFFLEGDWTRIISTATGRATIYNITGTTTIYLNILEDFDRLVYQPGEWRIEGSPHVWLVVDGTVAAGGYITMESYRGTPSTGDWELVDAFRAEDVGKYIIVWGGVVQITGITDANTITGLVVGDMTDFPQTWQEIVDVGYIVPAPPGGWTLESEVWPDTYPYPACAEFTQDRLALAGRNVWLSRSGDYENFARGSADDAAIVVPMPSQDSAIWLRDKETLIAGTASREVSVRGGQDGVFTPASCHTETKSRYGSHTVGPVVAGSDLLFAQVGGVPLRTLTPNPDSNEWWAPSVSAIAEHLFRVPIAQLARLRVPDSILFAVANGLLLCDPWERPEKVTTAWSHFLTLGDFESVVVLPHSLGEEILVVVRREIGGMRLRYVEVFDGSLSMDAALIYEGDTAVEEMRGLRHLEGQSVVYKVDDVAYAGTVSQGVLPLAASGTAVEIGLAYSSKWIPVEPNIETPNGTIQARRTRLNELAVRWYCTSGTPTICGEAWQLPEEAVTPYTGDTRTVEFGWVNLHGTPRIIIEQATPYPATVLGVRAEITVED